MSCWFVGRETRGWDISTEEGSSGRGDWRDQRPADKAARKQRVRDAKAAEGQARHEKRSEALVQFKEAETRQEKALARGAIHAVKVQPGADLFAKGINGQIGVEGEWLTIHRRGFGRLGHSKGDRRIPLRGITAVQMRPAGLTSGFLRVSVPGTPEHRGGLKNAEKDENAVMFRRSQQPGFEAVRDAIEKHIGRVHVEAQPVPAAPPLSSLADELAKLALLRDGGVLTDDEFQQQKARLLG